MGDPAGGPDRRRVVVTGVGAVTPVGASAADSFAATVAAEVGSGPITAWDPTGHPVRFAAEAIGFDPGPLLPPREARRVDRASQLGIVAAEEALQQAGLVDGPAAGVDPDRVAVSIGSGVGGILTLEDQIQVRVERGPQRVSPLLIPMMMANATAGLVAMRHGFRGPAASIATACASGASSIAAGVELIRSGRADVVVAGGTEAAITPTALAAFARMAALSTRNDDPAKASRPFDRDRDGFVMGEGAGILVLESEAHAADRGAPTLGVLAGHGASCDAHHITSPSPDGAGAIACMREALADAGIGPADVTHVNAHGTSTPLNDATEARALAVVFGPDGPPVTATKGSTGHLIGAAGAVEAVLGLLAAATGTVPPIANLMAPDEGVGIDLVRGGPRSVVPGPVLSNSFGFGGHNVSLVLSPAG